MSNHKHVMIIDDSQLSRLMLRSIIAELEPDWQITEAASAQEAMEKLDQGPYDLMTLDMNMPGGDGLSLAPKLLDRWPETKIALLTANIQEAVQERAEQMGLEFIAKPITEEKLKQFIHHE